MADTTVEVVGLADGAGFRYPVEGTDPTEYATGLVTKGQTVEVSAKEADRLIGLGAVAKAGSKQGKAATAEAEAAPLEPAGVTPAQPNNEDEAAIQSAVGSPDEPSAPADTAELKTLTVAQLKNLADARGIEYGKRDTKPKLVKKIAQAAEQG